MEYSIYKITLDIHKPGSQVLLSCKKNDTCRRIEARLMESGKPYAFTSECQAVFSAEKPDGTKLFNNCTIEDGKIIYDFTAQTTAAAGSMPCEFRIYGSDDALLVSSLFTIDVHDTVYTDGDTLASETEVDELTSLISQAGDAIDDANDAADAADAAAVNAQAIADMTITSSTLPTGSTATATKTVDADTGAVTLTIGVPRGEPGTTEWDGILNKPTEYPPSAHTHAWSTIASKPDTFTPSAHTHTSEDVTYGDSTVKSYLDEVDNDIYILQVGKSDEGHTHEWSDINNPPSEYPPSAHNHTWQTITNKPSTYAPSAHTHAIADVTNLQSTLTSQSEAIETLADYNETPVLGTLDCSITASTGKLSANSACATVYASCNPSTTYTVKKTAGGRFCVGYHNSIPAVGENISGCIADNTASEITITTGETASYIVAFVYYSSTDSAIGRESMLSSVSIQGSEIFCALDSKARQNIASLSEQIDKHEDEIYNGYVKTDDIKDSLTWHDGYISNSGVFSTSSLSKYAFFEIKNGQKVTVNTRNTNICVIGKAESTSSTTITTIVRSGGTDSYQTFEYTATEDFLCSVCVRWAESEVYITYYQESIIDRLTEQSSEIDTLEDTKQNKFQRVYLGNITFNSSGLFKTSFLKTDTTIIMGYTNDMIVNPFPSVDGYWYLTCTYWDVPSILGKNITKEVWVYIL